MIATATPASADGYHHRGKIHGGYHHGHKGHKGHHYKHHKRHHHSHHKRHGNDDFLLGAGIIGGAIIVGSVLSRPQPSPPPVVYVIPPPAPYCVQDEVYRYLPDGRVQWGTRTRCY